MYVTDEMLAEMAAIYGTPRQLVCRYAVDDTEREFIASAHSEKNRNHDFTLYIPHPEDLPGAADPRYLVIAKTVYPQGMYRSMSGGLLPEESFETGIAREAAEELGCTVRVRTFLLRTEVCFQGPEQAAHWRSFVFLADCTGGDFRFTDTHEIREVRWARLSEFERFGTLFRNGPKGAMHYRASLHEYVRPLLPHA